jgi:hypothetical protein
MLLAGQVIGTTRSPFIFRDCPCEYLRAKRSRLNNRSRRGGAALNESPA